MKIITLVLAIILSAIIASCKGGKQSAEDIIIVDVKATYPEKELILQDFMDVEYVPLETTDEFITHGRLEVAGKNLLLVTNRVDDGNILVFDRTGKGLRIINRLGQGGEEYTDISELVLDEDNEEIFVKDNSIKKILVYDLYGNFKRSFKLPDTDGYYTYTFNYDRDNLISYKNYIATEDNEQPHHFIISKQDGSITREIKVPFKEFRTPVITTGEFTIMTYFHQTIPYNGDFALVNASSDTIYNYSADGKITPLIVRTPSILSMDPEVFLYPGTLTDRYYFMYAMKKEINTETMKGFSGTDLMYDKQEGALFQYTVYNDDYSTKKLVFLRSYPINEEIAVYEQLDAHKLVEAYENDQLKGRLKEIAATLDEESNPVLMLVKYRK